MSVASLTVDRRLIDLNALLNHLIRENCIAFLLSELVKLFFITMLQVKHVVEAGVCHPGPADDFLPVLETSTVRKRRVREVVVHVLQEFLGRQISEDKHSMEATKSEDEDTEKHCDKSSNKADPVGFEDAHENLTSV